MTHGELSAKAAVRLNLKLSLTQRQKAILEDRVNLAGICEEGPALTPGYILFVIKWGHCYCRARTSQPLRFPRTHSGQMSRFRDHRHESGLAGNNERGGGE